MHIAICDDNIADRHQMERLFKKESDARKEVYGPLYIDSFGSSAPLLANPRQYNAFFIDLCHTENTNTTDVVNTLISYGINVPIILCSSVIDYSTLSFPSNVIFLQKPIKASDLHHCIDYIQNHVKQIKPSIEIRDDYHTFYLKEEEIMYVTKKRGRLTITLSDGQTLSTNPTMEQFFSQVESLSTFVVANHRTIINVEHIHSLIRNKAIMNDDTIIKVQHSVLHKIQEIMSQK